MMVRFHVSNNIVKKEPAGDWIYRPRHRVEMSTVLQIRVGTSIK